MATGPRYRVPYRRRKEGKTNYRLRRALVLSRLPRLVVRGTLKHMIVQVIEAKMYGDTVVVSAHSSELMKRFGWSGGGGNVSASYLTGLLCGFRAAAGNIEKCILDLGLQLPSAGARVFAALKGFIDAGVSVPHKKDLLPSEKRIEGEHIVKYANQLVPEPEVYKRVFSGYLSRGLMPEKLSEHFYLIKKLLVSSFEVDQT